MLYNCYVVYRMKKMQSVRSCGGQLPRRKVDGVPAVNDVSVKEWRFSVDKLLKCVLSPVRWFYRLQSSPGFPSLRTDATSPLDGPGLYDVRFC